MAAWDSRFYRIDQHGRGDAPARPGEVQGHRPKQWTTEELPIQKFYWKDPYARLEAEKNKNRIFRYKIVPLEGALESSSPWRNCRSC